MSARGSVYSWCGCRAPGNGRRLGTRCPRRGQDGHGSWYLSLELPPGLDGSRRRIRRGGFPSQASAELALRRLRMPSPGDDTASPTPTVGQWLERWLVDRAVPRPSTPRRRLQDRRGHRRPHHQCGLPHARHAPPPPARLAVAAQPHAHRDHGRAQPRPPCPSNRPPTPPSTSWIIDKATAEGPCPATQAPPAAGRAIAHRGRPHPGQPLPIPPAQYGGGKQRNPRSGRVRRQGLEPRTRGLRVR